MQMKCKLRVRLTRPQDEGEGRITLELVTQSGEVIMRDDGQDLGFGCHINFGPVWVEVKLSDVSSEIFKEG